jgi:hypothetical protein
MLDFQRSSDALAAGAVLVKLDERRTVAPLPLVEVNSSSEGRFLASSLTNQDEGGIQSCWRRVSEFSRRSTGADIRKNLIIISDSTEIGVSPWVEELYDASRGQVSDDHIVRMFNALETAVYSDIDGLDVNLAVIDLKRLAPDFIVGIPRALYPLRDHLFNWHPFVLKAWAELSRRHGASVRELLQGLL